MIEFASRAVDGPMHFCEDRRFLQVPWYEPLLRNRSRDQVRLVA